MFSLNFCIHSEKLPKLYAARVLTAKLLESKCWVCCKRLGSRLAAAVLARLLWTELPCPAGISLPDFETQHQHIRLVSLGCAPSAA